MNIKVRDSKYGQDFLRSSFGGSLGLGLWCLRSPKGLGVHAPKRKKSIPPPNGIILDHRRVRTCKGHLIHNITSIVVRTTRALNRIWQHKLATFHSSTKMQIRSLELGTSRCRNGSNKPMAILKCKPELGIKTTKMRTSKGNYVYNRQRYINHRLRRRRLRMKIQNLNMTLSMMQPGFCLMQLPIRFKAQILSKVWCHQTNSLPITIQLQTRKKARQQVKRCPHPLISWGIRLFTKTFRNI
jgi:hypothetical protein